MSRLRREQPLRQVRAIQVLHNDVQEGGAHQHLARPDCRASPIPTLTCSVGPPSSLLKGRNWVWTSKGRHPARQPAKMCPASIPSFDFSEENGQAERESHRRATFTSGLRLGSLELEQSMPWRWFHQPANWYHSWGHLQMQEIAQWFGPQLLPE